jgi:hypothetical protein
MCTRACSVFGAEAIATAHPPALLFQSSLVGYIVEDIFSQKFQTLQFFCFHRVLAPEPE